MELGVFTVQREGEWGDGGFCLSWGVTQQRRCQGRLLGGEEGMIRSRSPVYSLCICLWGRKECVCVCVCQRAPCGSVIAKGKCVALFLFGMKTKFRCFWMKNNLHPHEWKDFCPVKTSAQTWTVTNYWVTSCWFNFNYVFFLLGLEVTSNQGFFVCFLLDMD